MLYRRGTKGYCGECGELMFVFAADIVRGTPISEAMFDQTQGQAPFKMWDECRCKACHYQWGSPFPHLANIKPVRFVVPE